jgi:signal transduction histidine kinase
MEGVWEPTPERLKSCYEEIGRLSGLVSDLEKLSQAENDGTNLRKTPVDLLEAARAVSAGFARGCAKKHIALAVAGASAVVLADKDRISQVIANLLANAVRYTPENGHIRITARDTPEHGVLAVEDDGIGISEQDLPLIFERFYRADASRTRKTGGAGIGLAIVRSIVAAHDGTVTAESRMGHGSRFTVMLPKDTA